jgi:chromosome segregation ATPase
MTTLRSHTSRLSSIATPPTTTNKMADLSSLGTEKPEKQINQDAKETKEHTDEAVSPNETLSTDSPIQNKADMSNSAGETPDSDVTKANISLIDIYDSLQALTITISNLETSQDKLTSELHSTRTSYDKKLDGLEQKLLDDQQSKHLELSEDLKSHKEDVTTEVNTLKVQVVSGEASVEDLKDTIGLQEQNITDLVTDLEMKTKRMDEIEARLEYHIRHNDKRIRCIQEGVDEARQLANEVESHG